MLRKWALAAAMLAGTTGMAAADGMDYGPAKVSEHGYRWQGFYIGINGGGASSTSSTSSVDGNGNVPTVVFPTVGFPQEAKEHGALFGGTAGYNFMLGHHWLLGIEGDFDGSTVRGANTTCSVAGCSTFSTSHAAQEWMATLRGRVGYAFGHVLVYGTGGAVWERSHTDRVSSVLPAVTIRSTGVESGWTAGGGVEIGLLPGMSIKGEYLFVNHDVDNSFVYNTGTRNSTAAQLSRHSTGDADENIWRVGLNIKLFDRREIAEPLK